MLKPIRLDIVSEIRSDDQEDVERIEQQLKGHFDQKEDRWVLRYWEEPGTQEEVRTTVKAKEDEVTVIRQGAVSYRVTYRPGQTSLSLVETPGGKAEMEVHTLDYRRRMEESHGQIQFSFRLRMAGEEMGHYQLKIQWTGVSA
ncbi:hypothetical protein GCM10011571_03530 [Marinithermofilum abyssi]|uniref:DUF1934 domain-containing protein n=1 Tax=Marinithermofilum abyssi TaxID=1571185 RepID=A0A8J2VH56_9BACL|nr:hypothetical protein GCM10011571_03530 [Marinithermofilum abyssi]